MKTIISAIVAAVIIFNNVFGGSTYKITSHANTDDHESENDPAGQLISEIDKSAMMSQADELDPPEPLQCNVPSQPTFYLGPVIPEKINIVLSGPAGSYSIGRGVSSAVSTDFYVGAIFNYGVFGNETAIATRDGGYPGGHSLWNGSDSFGGSEYPAQGKYCSSIPYPVYPEEGYSSTQICNMVCPDCISHNPPGDDPHAVSCTKGNPLYGKYCYSGGVPVSIGWRFGNLYKPSETESSGISNIQFIYYGIPKSLPPRSKLSDNKPKNTAGDSRECEASRCDDSATSSGDPIDVLTGNFNYSYTDLSLKTIAGDLSLQRSYASHATDTQLHPTTISPGWTHNQDTRLIFDGSQVWFKAHTLNQYRFDVIGDHVYSPYNGVLATLDYDNGQYILTTTSQSVYVFDDDGRLLTWTNEFGYGFTYSYLGGNLDRVTEPVSGRYLQFNYMAGILQSVTDSAGRQVSYAYDGNGDLSNITDVRGNEWGYAYNNDHQVRTVLAPPTASQVLLTISYDPQGRAYEQHDGGGNQLTHIDFNPDGSSTSTDANGIPTNYTPDCRGVVTRSEFPGNGVLPPYYIDREYDHNFNLIAMRGSEDETATSFKWSMDGAQLKEMTDQVNNFTEFTYDGDNHLRHVIVGEHVIDNNGLVEDIVLGWQDYIYNGPLLMTFTKSSSLGDVITQYTYTTIADAPQPVNLLETTTDALGHVTQYRYDALGQLTTIIDADLNETHFTYDSTGQVVTITDALGRVQHIDYEPSGVVKKITQNYDPNPPPNEGYQYNLSTSYGYDEQGRPSTITDALNHVVSTTMYDDASRAYKVFDAYNTATTYIYNDDGTLDTVTIDPNFQTSYGYDDLGRVTKVYDAYHHLVKSYTYYSNSTIATETDAAGLVTSYSYDALHRVTQAKQRIEGGIDRVVSTTYDTYGDITSITDPLGRVTKYEYSDPGRLSAVTENFIEAPPPGYDIYATNIRTNYIYNILGNLMEVWDANNHETTYGYDDLYRLHTITDALGHQTVYDYTALGQQEYITRPGEAPSHLTYDMVNRLKTIDYPAGPTPDVTFTYNELSLLTDMYDDLGHTHWEYDLLGQPTSITDPFGRTVGYKYDTLGDREKLTYPGGAYLDYQYDANGMLEHVLDGTKHLVDYGYDSAGRLLTEAYANGVETSYSYYLDSQVKSINHKMNGRDLALYEYEYYLNGNLKNAKETNRYPNYRYLPLINKNTLGFNYREYFNFYQLEPEGMDSAYPAPGKSYNESPSLWVQLADFLDALFDMKTASAFSDLSGQQPDRTISYTYDSLDRLKTASYSTGENFEYMYYKTGNRSSQTAFGITTSYSYDRANRLTSVNGVSYTWNNNGSLASTGLTNYTYDPGGRLSGITSPLGNFQFGYDGLGNRYTQTKDGQTTNYTLDQAAGLTTVLREGTTTYLYGLGLIGQETGGQMTVALTDRLGSVRQLITDDRNQTLLQSFDPFGNILNNIGEGVSGFGYTGEQTDGSGLVYLRARYYDPQTGRFITPDPFPGVLSQPSTQNAYPYVTNNPLRYTDPSGEIIPILLAAAGATLAGGIISGGLNLLSQCKGYSSFQECTKCADWTAVGAAAGAGALAGLFGFGVGLIAIPMGMGFGMAMFGGFLVGMASGQVYRIAELSILGKQDQIPGSLGHLDDLLIDGLLGSAGAAFGYGVGNLSKNIASNKINDTEILLRYIARRSKIIAGEGSGRFYGTKLHNIYSNYIRSLKSPDIFPEITYAKGFQMRYGYPGSIRVDTILGTPDSPIAIFELKTGTARLSSARIKLIRFHLPEFCNDIPIIEINP